MKHLVAVLWLATAAEAAPPLIVYYEIRPPYTDMRDGKLEGLLGPPAIGALQRAGIDYVLREAPYNRHMALIGRNLEPACAIGRFKTAEREALGKFSEPIYRDQPFVVLVRHGNPRLHGLRRFDKILADDRLVVAVRENYSYGAYADGLLPRAAARVLRSPASHADMARMVLHQMADLMMVTADEADSIRRSLGSIGEGLSIWQLEDMRYGELRYFYCARQVDDALLRRLNTHIPPLPN
ncbi:hypothetical protein [Chitinimonas lacunae]|uniref:Transporter substrate-binding domain-containing protein n=1 Tax=Chitinimonas lacunae TaxID=1963018 RepID=A0ABV8MP19_9NEIS